MNEDKRKEFFLRIPLTFFSSLLSSHPKSHRRSSSSSLSPVSLSQWTTVLLLIFQIVLLTPTVTNANFVFQIPDQQAFIGKLFYYKIEPPSSVVSISVEQAGSNIPELGTANKLPPWLRFNAETGELYGTPIERRIYFMQVKVKLNTGALYEDIFVIETNDPPLYMKNFHSPSGDSLDCRIEFRRPFNTIDDLWALVKNIKNSIQLSDGDFTGWLNNFAFNTLQSEQHQYNQHGTLFKLIYNIERCHQTDDAKTDQNTEHIFLDSKSEKLLATLAELKIDSELIKVQRIKEPEFDFSQIPTIQNHDSSGKHSLNRPKHRRRNAAYGDDIHSTPVLMPTLETSTIDLNGDFILSRTLIPSMVSPTFTWSESATPTYQLSSSIPSSVRQQPHYPQLYSTPILMPEFSSAHTQHIFDKDHHTVMMTPVFGVKSSSVTPQINQIETSATSVFLEVLSPTPTLQQPEMKSSEPAVPDSGSQTKKEEVEEIKTTTTEAPLEEEASKSATTVPTSTTTTTTSKSNNLPFVNRRISKLSITAGKYWEFYIPETTFFDAEDGSTQNLKLSFYKDLDQPPNDYWIQFDHENHYLYALPTEDNIGKYSFRLVATDSSGGEVSANIEIFVRQPRDALTYTHRFTFQNVTWNQEVYFEKIQAVSTIFQRMATQVFEDALSSRSSDASNKPYLLKRILVLSIQHDDYSNSWTITWLNDSLPSHPCPANEIRGLFTKLYLLDDPVDSEGFMTPSRELRDALLPEFDLRKVKSEFIGRSSCGSFAITEETSSSRHKEKIVFSNKLNRLGPYRVGQPFKFQIPKDTVYSVTRQIDTRELLLTMAPIEPKYELPDFIYFDVKEQTIYGSPFKQEHVNTFEFRLIAEDPVTGGSEQDLFVIDIENDINTREEYLFESTMSFLIKNIENVRNSQLVLTAKDFYQVSQTIATQLMNNSNLDAVRILEINRHRFSRLPDIVDTSMDNNIQSDMSDNMIEKEDVQYTPKLMKDSNGRKRRQEPVVGPKTYESFQDEFELEYLSKQSTKKHHHGHRQGHHNHHHRSHRSKRALSIDSSSKYFYEIVWTNRSLVTSYHHSSNAYGSEIETIICPNATIHDDIYGHLFPASKDNFMRRLNLTGDNVEDVLDVYSLLFDQIEANVDFVCVEWQPKSVCSALKSRMLGAKPIKTGEPKEEETVIIQESNPQPGAVTSTPPLSATPPVSESEYPPTQQFSGDKLSLIIPPVAILTALLFAVCIGCCFHRANMRRKAMGNNTNIDDEDASLYRQRIPIKFEFERDEAATMLDTSKRNYNVVNYQKQFMGEPSQPMMMKTIQPSSQRGPHLPQQNRNMATYQMLPQQL